MENASKALIIAGAILLSILIIGLGMLVFNNAKEALSGANLDKEKIQTVNAQYEAYIGEAIKGSQVKTLCNLVRDNNLTADQSETFTITINSVTEATEINKLKNTIANGKTYKVEATYGSNKLIETITFKDGEGIVYVSSMHLLKYVKYYFYVALFVSLLIFFLPTFIFIKRKVKYINILKQEVLNMSQGDLSHAMTIMSHDELAILAQEMDTLRITLASNYQNEARIKESHQEMITCLSHDLRTPLTALRGYLDILCLHCYKDEKQMDHYLNSCIEKTEQIKDLSNKTFEYSLVYNDDLIPSLETISSESFIQYIEEHLEYLELEGFKIEKEITISSVQLQLDLSMMKRMMDNICSNIQKYARKEQPIYLQISIEKGNIKIVFENEKKEINHEVESNKIGLKSVNKIIEIHQGQCFIQDLMDSFILIITFPCYL